MPELLVDRMECGHRKSLGALRSAGAQHTAAAIAVSIGCIVAPNAVPAADRVGCVGLKRMSDRAALAPVAPWLTGAAADCG